MLHISDNIRIIRRLWRKTQAEFAEYFVGINENNQKSYELKRANPSVLYVAELSKLTGISERDLRDRKLDIKEIPAKAPLLDEVKNVKPGTSEVVFDSKEGVLRLLNKALDENARHASANEKNASAHEKNAESLQELVKILGISLNSTGTGETFQSSGKKNAPIPDHEERKEEFLDKPKIHLKEKKRVYKKDISD